MLPSWQPCVVVTTLYDVRDGRAVDLKIESQIPSKVRRPENDQTPSGLSGGGSNRNRTDERKNQEEPAGRITF
jgi:hypothetical protein